MSTDPVRYRNILRAVAATPWAILPETLLAITDLLALRAAGGHLEAAEIEERIAAGPGSRKPYQQGAGAVAVIPLTGVLMPRASLMAQISGATSLAQVGAAIDAAAADPEIDAIVLDVDSPGGAVTLVPETAAKLRAASQAGKRTVAVANGTAASAAYWIASQADELVVTPSALVGSIGVLAAHENVAAAEEQRGVETTLVHAGRYKVEGNPFEPLADEARGEMQRLVDEFYGMFVADVSRGRKASRDTVRSDYGEGRVLTAKRAVGAGMADRVEAFDATLARVLRAPRKTSSGARAEQETAIDADLWVPTDTQATAEAAAGPDDEVLQGILATVTETTTSLKEASS